MKATTKQLLSELLEAHPEFASQEKELQSFIEKFLSARPEMTIDEAFKQKLHEALQKYSQQLQSSQNIGGWGHFLQSWWKPLSVGAVCVIAGIIIIPQWNQPLPKDGEEKAFVQTTSSRTAETSDETSGEDFALLNITETGEEDAFGDIPALENSSGEGMVMEAKMAEGVAYGRGGGGGGGMAFDQGMIMPPNPWGERINYEYSYEGDLPQLLDKVTVYRNSVKELKIPFNDTSLLTKEMNFVDIKAFQNLNLENVQFMEDRDMGYSISFNFRYPSLSIYENYEQWRDHYQNCSSNGVCQPLEPFKEADLLSDKELIKIANDFLKKYGISRDNLGDPKVQKYWEEPLYQGGKPDIYPDGLAVQYPIIVDGQTVTDQYGNEQSVYININMRVKKVNNAYFTPLSLESSKYTALDEEEVRSMIEEGGLQGFRYSNPDKVMKVELENPQFKLVQISRFDQRKTMPDQFYVPALLFSVKQDTENKDEARIMPYYYQQRFVVVPLVKTVQLKNTETKGE